MKHNLLFAALLASLTFASCNNNSNEQEPGTYPDKAAYASINVVESKEVEDQEAYFFVLDNGDKVFLVDNPTNIKLESYNQVRSVIFYTIIEDYTEEGSESLDGATYECDYGVRLFSVKDVSTTQAVTVETEEDSDEIADHALSYLYNSFQYSNGYINILAGIKADKLANVKFYLVENLSEEADETEDGFLNLELRYDRGTDEAMGSTYEQYVSLGLEPFAEQLEGKKGVLLRVITLQSGTGFAKIEFEDEDEDDSRAINSMRSVKQL